MRLYARYTDGSTIFFGYSRKIAVSYSGLPVVNYVKKVATFEVTQQKRGKEDKYFSLVTSKNVPITTDTKN